NSTQGPIDVSGSGYTFIGLTEDTNYRIIVIARNANNEYDVEQIDQRTAFLNVTLNAPPAGSVTVDGSEYYTAGNSYDLVLNVTNNEDAWASITQIQFNFGPKTIIINSPDGSDNTGLTYAADPGENVSYTITGVSNNFQITLTYALSAVAGGSAADIPGAARSISVDMTTARYGNKSSASFARTFGIVTDGIKTVVTAAATGTSVDLAEYYLSPPSSYNFTVSGTANGHSWACLTDVRISIPRDGGADLLFSMNPTSASGTSTDINGSGETASYTRGGTYDNFSIVFAYAPTANTAALDTALGPHNVTGSATSAIIAGAESDVDNHTYGIATRGIITNTAAITTGADTTQIGTPAANYFLPSRNYVFTASVTANGHSWACVTDVTLRIPVDAVPANDILLSFNPTGLGPVGVTAATGGGSFTAVVGGLDYNDFNVTFTYTPDWTLTAAAVGGRNIRSTATSAFYAATPVTSANVAHTYGICTSAKVIIAQDGNAADGLVNPWDATFNVSGGIVYNIAAATIADLVTPDTDITVNPILVYSYNAGANTDTAVTDANSDSTLNLAVPAAWFSGNGIANDGIGPYTWRVRTTIAGVNQVLVPDAALDVDCDKIEIIDMEFQSGGGYSANAPVYNRNIYTAGTQVRVQTRMQYGLGNTTVAANLTVSYNYGGGARTTTVTVPANGDWSGWVEIENPSSGEVPAGSTYSSTDYDVSVATGAGGIFGGVGQNVVGRIVQTAYVDPTILWDNADPPGVNTTPLTGFAAGTIGADTIEFTWTPIAANLAAAGNDADFYSYRVYYKPTASATWAMVDRTLYPASLGVIGTGTFTIINLEALTQYDYYITAIDVFGNETVLGGTLSATTLPFSSTETISDGIHSYGDSTYTAVPGDRPVYDSAVRIEVNIVGASQPDSLNIIVASTAIGNLVTGVVLDPGLTLDTDYYRIETLKTSPNVWVGYISSENPLIVSGQDCKFIMEAVQGGTPIYYDHDSSDLDANDDVWTFSVVDPPKVKPWPTRVLNNVITDKNPRAYPAYYLTHDANVTIKAYDIKGRPVAILIDNAPRKSGQNIRERGWAGTNKAGRKLGVGLYYIHIKAKRATDGKVLIDKFEKVVMAR
ncbi:MAG TPA: fibronectin type III domain-containing protein, partial [Spirochaetota bacterium]|nr:fibronectin type III domain-containing protein [Spirochaetota bacterium]